MGVLKVNVATALLPDWRNVGCGGASGTVTPAQYTFEAGTDGWTAGTSNCAVTSSTDSAAEATHSLKMTRTVLDGLDAEAFGPLYAASPGQQWRIAASVNCGSNATFSVRPLIRFYNASMTLLGGYFGGFNPSPAGTWIKYGALATAPASTAFVRAVWHVDGSGLSSPQYFDRVLLGLSGAFAGTSNTQDAGATVPDGYYTDTTPVADPIVPVGRLKLKLPDGSWVQEKCDGAAPAGPDLAVNGDFETNVSDWAADDHIGGPTTFTRSTAWSASGTASLAVTGFGGNGSWIKSITELAVTAGAGYTLAGVLKRNGGTTTSGFHIGVAWYDSSHAQISETDAGTPGTTSDGAIGGTITAPAGAVYARLYFRAIGTAALYYVDNITFRLTSAASSPLKVWDGTAWQIAACMVPA